MGLDNGVVEGCIKKIVQASPRDISRFRKRYLRSLSPGNNALKSFRQSTHESCRLPNLVYNIIAKRLSRSRENQRRLSIQTSQGIRKAQAPITHKPKVRKIVFRESLRLNNL